MVFNSIIYLLFLAIVVIAYYTFPGRYRWIWLLIASIAFYLSFIPSFFVLLVFIVFTNYFLGKGLAKSPDKRNSFFIFIVVLNILVLAFFKYFSNIFPDNQIHLYIVDLFYPVESVNRMILPLGLSYLIFTVLSYHIEIKRKTIQPEKHLGYFSLYLLFFPKITQGPIERPQNLISQLHENCILNSVSIVEGLKLMLWGYFKKLVVADRLAIYVNAVYNNSEHHNGPTLLVATIFFAFQIYADFSGYTDIALGSARLFGIKLTNNFNRPYFSTSVKEFWNRWHISFSSWLRDYIFLPLAYFLSGRMNKQNYLFISKEKWIYFISIMITFSICGIWHGVGWTYLIWGILFGIFQTYSNWTSGFHKKIRKRLHIKKSSRLNRIINTFLTFCLVLFTWIFFRSNNVTDAFKIIKKIFTFNGKVFFGETSEVMNSMFHSIIAIFMLLIIEVTAEYFYEGNTFFKNANWIVKSLFYALLIIIIVFLGVFDGGQFIYFQF
jgi:alginate O-acetyltransferase complex protein AlgI